MTSRVHMIVRGLVQGVGFRYFVARRAESLALGGFVRNLPDGGVEIEAVGERPVLDEFIGEVRHGPRAAHVTDVILEWNDLPAPDRSATHFAIR